MTRPVGDTRAARSWSPAVILRRLILSRREHDAVVRMLRRERDSAQESWESWRDDADRLAHQINAMWAWIVFLAIVCGIGWGLFGGSL